MDQALGPAGARQRPSNSEDAAGQPAELAGGAAAGAAVTGFNNCGARHAGERCVASLCCDRDGACLCAVSAVVGLTASALRGRLWAAAAGVTLTKENADRDTLIKLNSTQIKKLKVLPMEARFPFLSSLPASPLPPRAAQPRVASGRCSGPAP